MSTRETESAILKALRKDKGLNQGVLAELLGVSAQAYQKYEYGTAELTHENLVKLADFYHVSTDYLLGRTPVKAMATLAEDEPTEEEIKQLEAQIIASYTQMSIETRRESIKILMQIVGDVFSDSIEDEDSTEEPSASDSTA